MQVLGGPIAAGLLLMDGLANIRGWQWIFIIQGSITVAIGILLKAGQHIAWLSLLVETCMSDVHLRLRTCR